jgi:chromosome partitioning protein
MRTTAVVNQKGGVGKTATTIGTGGALAELGRRVLLVDLDPQGHLTAALQVPAGVGAPSLAHALTGQWNGSALDLTVHHSTPGVAGGRLDVIPHTVDMFDVVREIDKLRAREGRLQRVLSTLDGEYDHVLIDCPPALDALTDNALVASDGVLVPVQAEDSSLRALELLLEQIEAIEDALRQARPLTIHGLVVSMLERGGGGKARSTIGRSVIAAFEDMPIPILATVPRGVPITEAWRYGRTVTDYAPETEHAQAYRDLGKVLDAA